MTKDEALKLAKAWFERNTYADEAVEVYEAIEQARSQPVQEPVAWMGTDIEGNPNKFRLNPFNGGVALYKKPQSVKVWDAEGYDALMQELELWKAAAQRQWVGLTREEVLNLGAAIVNFEYAAAIEAKLKEKNT